MGSYVREGAFIAEITVYKMRIGSGTTVIS